MQQDSTSKLKEVDVYSLQRLGAFTILHPEAILIKNSPPAHKWVCENCHFKELPFSGLREFPEVTVTSPTTINSVEYENMWQNLRATEDT